MRWRLAIVRGVVAALVVVLLGRLWQVQVARSGLEERVAVGGASTRTVPLAAPRGRILDAHGTVLAQDTARLSIVADRSALDRLAGDERDAVFGRLSRLLGEPVARLAGRTEICGDAGAPKPPLCWNGSPYQPVPLATDVRPDIALAVAERPEEYAGVSVEPDPVRTDPRPGGLEAAHLLGYVGAAGPEDLARKGIEPFDRVGRAGLEKAYDDVLRGRHGTRTYRVDASGRVVGVAAERPSTPGDDLVTSIDARLQSIVETQLGKAIQRARAMVDPVTGRRFAGDSGAAVVLDTRTGRVVAMASAPSYDPNLWRGGLTTAERAKLFAPSAPLLSRATGGAFAPGSTFKPVTTAAALHAGFPAGTRLSCPSMLRIGGRAFHNFRDESFGTIGFAKALAVSCDTFFYQVGTRLWRSKPTRDAVAAMARAFGFGRATGIDLPGESSGGLGTTPRYAGIAAMQAIGQGETVVTPLQLAVGYAAISNGGRVFAPRIGERVVDERGRTVRAIDPPVVGRLPLTSGQIRTLQGDLLTTSTEGTGRGVFAGYPLDRDPIASKTGTAEVAGRQTTSWFASFDHRYAVVMMVAQGGTGSGTCGPSVRQIWDALGAGGRGGGGGGGAR